MQNSYFADKSQELLHQQRPFEQLSENTMKYFSVNHSLEKHINCEMHDIHGNVIACRHLSHYFLIMEQQENNSYKAIIGDRENIKKTPFLMQCYYDEHKIFYKADDYRFIDYKTEFGSTLYQLAQSNLNGENSQLYLSLATGIHAMAIVIKHKAKSNIYVVKFYDPNHMSHCRIVLSDLISLNQITIEQLLGPVYLNAYFHLKDTEFMIAVYNSPKDYLGKSEDRFIKAMINNMDKHLQHGNYKQFRLALIQMLNNNRENPGLIQALIDRIFLANMLADDTSQALHFGMTDYVEVILDSANHLSEFQQYSLLVLNTNLIGLTDAVLKNKIYDLRSYTNRIVNSNLPEQYKLNLLKINLALLNLDDPQSTSSLNQYFDLILKSQLSKEMQHKLLYPTPNLDLDQTLLQKFNNLVNLAIKSTIQEPPLMSRKAKPRRKVLFDFDNCDN
jgi:hypothetical protein